MIYEKMKKIKKLWEEIKSKKDSKLSKKIMTLVVNSKPILDKMRNYIDKEEYPTIYYLVERYADRFTAIIKDSERDMLIATRVPEHLQSACNSLLDLYELNLETTELAKAIAKDVKNLGVALLHGVNEAAQLGSLEKEKVKKEKLDTSRLTKLAVNTREEYKNKNYSKAVRLCNKLENDLYKEDYSYFPEIPIPVTPKRLAKKSKSLSLLKENLNENLYPDDIEYIAAIVSGGIEPASHVSNVLEKEDFYSFNFSTKTKKQKTPLLNPDEEFINELEDNLLLAEDWCTSGYTFLTLKEKLEEYNDKIKIILATMKITPFAYKELKEKRGILVFYGIKCNYPSGF